MNPATPWARLARWALPIAIGLTSVALVAAAWSIVRGVDAASTTLVRGQAGELGARIAFELRDPEGASSAEELFETLASEGLTYLALVDGDERFVDEAGHPAVSREATQAAYRSGPRREIEEVGDRVRVIRRRPQRTPRLRGRRPAPLQRLRRPGLVFEFTPQAALDLRRRSEQVLATGIIGAVLLLGIAIALGRWQVRRDERQRKADHEHRLAQLGAMSAVLAHEIRNPLASLKGNAQLLERMSAHDDKLHPRAERVVSEAVRLEQLTSDLLEFARSGTLERSACDPGRLLVEVAAELEGKIDIDSADAPARFNLDAGRIRQVLTNLLGNAVEASPTGVRARVYRDGGMLVYEIDDSGPGIDAEALPHLFEAFFTTKTHGTGLGLALSRRLIELHGGTLTAENRPEGGARFRATLSEVA